jgi:branched-chain amino acid transport system substrate-binding protein
MQRYTRVLALGVLVGAILTGCSSSKTKVGSPAPATSATTPAGSATTAASSNCHLDQAPKIVAMEETKGESTVAIDDYYAAQKMAVDEINGKGGVCGQQINLQRVSASATDAVAATAALLRAEAMKPDFLVGFPSGAIVNALIKELDHAGIPAVTQSADLATIQYYAGSSKWVFPTRRPSAGEIDVDMLQWAKDNLHATKIALITPPVTYGPIAVRIVEQEAKTLGLQIVAERTAALTATDMTEQVLALKGADVVINVAYPNQIGLALNQMQQNGIDIPTLSTLSGATAISQGVAKPSAISKVTIFADCNPAGDQPEWANKLAQSLGHLPDANAGAAYDDIYYIAKAIQSANSLDPAALQKALQTISYKGLCISDMHYDATGILGHSLVAADYSQKPPKTLQTFPVPVITQDLANSWLGTK